MNEEISVIFIDWWLIIRISTALVWGFAYGYWLHRNRDGQLFERRFTALATTLGLAVDLLIAINTDYWTTFAVIVASAVGIYAFAILDGYPEEINVNSYKLKWGLEDAAALSSKLADSLARILEVYQDIPQDIVASLSKSLATAHKLNDTIISARRGDYAQNKK